VNVVRIFKQKRLGLNSAAIIFIIYSLVFLWSRFQLIGNHFTHYDDLYAPYLFGVIGNYDPIYFSHQIVKYGGDIGQSLAPWVLGFMTEHTALFEFVKKLLVPIAIAKSSTFAPLQFFLTAFTINLDESYAVSLITSRLPSTIFSIATLLILWRFSKCFIGQLQQYFLLVGGLIISFSWMFLVYSVQAENYAAGVFSVITLIYIYALNSNKCIARKDSIGLGFILSVLCLLHYQTLFFLPGFYMGIVYSNRSDFYYRLRGWFPCIIINLIMVALTYYLFIGPLQARNPGIGWNAGPQLQYVFNQNCGDGWLGCGFQVFTNNILEVVQSIISFSDLGSPISILYGIVVMIMSGVGLIFLLVCKDDRLRGLGIMVSVTIFVWIFLVMMKILSFSPTRHSLVLLVPVSLLASYGVYALKHFIPIYLVPMYDYSVMVICLIVTVLFFWEFDAQKTERQDAFRLLNIESLINQFNVGTIITYGYTFNMALFPIVKNGYSEHFENIKPYTLKYSSKNRNRDSIMVVCASNTYCRPVVSSQTTEILSNLNGNQLPYKLRYHYEHKSNVLNCFGSKAGEGTNSIYLGVWSK